MARTVYTTVLVAFASATIFTAHSPATSQERLDRYTIAFASFSALNTDIFIADGTGASATPFLPHSGLDYNATLSANGRSVLFTSERGGSTDIYRANRDGSGLRRLTDHPAYDDQAALSPDGRFVAFVSSRSGNADIWILDIESGQLRNVTNHTAGDFRPAWSPDGEWLAFSSDRDSDGVQITFTFRHTTDIFVVRPDGTGLRRLTKERGVAGTPAWSPDGKSLVFYQGAASEIRGLTAPVNPAGTTQILLLDIATGATKTMTSGPGAKAHPQFLNATVVAYFNRGAELTLRSTNGLLRSGEFLDPSWTSDGRWMAYHRDVGASWPPYQAVPGRDARFHLIRTGVFPHFSPDGQRMTLISERAASSTVRNDILMTGIDAREPTIVFSDPQRSALAPVWSPDGNMIAFGLGRFFTVAPGVPTADVAVLDARTRETTILTDGTSNSGFPSWSPDGRQLVYREIGKDGRSRLLIRDVGSKAITPLVTDFGHVNFPAWSPRGTEIQFTSDRDGNYEIYKIDLSSRRITRLTDSPGNDAHGSWSPDGDWIAFSSVRQGFKDEGVLHPGNPQGSGDIYVMRADGTDVRILTDNPFEEATTAWIPAMRPSR
jgi:Tol biopolymer transport system component